MADQTKHKKSAKLRSQGLKSFITAASLAATIGGWGALSLGDVQPAAGSQQTPIIAGATGDSEALPTPPAITSPQDQSSFTGKRTDRRSGRFGQAPTTGSLPTDGTQPLSPMGITRSSR